MGLKGVLFAFILVVVVYVYLNKYPPHQETKELLSTIIVFDYDGRHSKVTLQNLIGGDAVIFLKVLPDDDNVYYLKSLNYLKKFDPQKQGYIALDNPEFKYFYFGRYLKRRNALEYSKLQSSGIAGIVLKYDGEDVASAQIILLDNSRRNLFGVQINSNLFDKTKLIGCDPTFRTNVEDFCN